MSSYTCIVFVPPMGVTPVPIEGTQQEVVDLIKTCQMAGKELVARHPLTGDELYIMHRQLDNILFVGTGEFEDAGSNRKILKAGSNQLPPIHRNS